MAKWRDEDHNGEEPTKHKVVITATDKIKTERGYVLVIRHVKAYCWGKGFMYEALSESGGLVKNGTVHSGTDMKAYDIAVAEGEKYFQDKMKEVDRIDQQIADAKK